MKKNIKIKRNILIVGIIALLLVGGFIGININKTEKPIYTGEQTSFVVENINIFAWSDLDGVCYSKFKDYSTEFNSPYKICFVSRSGSGIHTLTNYYVTYNVVCNCYGTNYHLKK